MFLQIWVACEIHGLSTTGLGSAWLFGWNNELFRMILGFFRFWDSETHPRCFHVFLWTNWSQRLLKSMEDKENPIQAELGWTDAQQPQEGQSCHSHSCPGAASAGPAQATGGCWAFRGNYLPSFHFYSSALPRYPLTIGPPSSKQHPSAVLLGSFSPTAHVLRSLEAVKEQHTKPSGPPFYFSVCPHSFHRTEVFYLLKRTCSKAIIPSMVMLRGFVQHQLCSFL